MTVNGISERWHLQPSEQRWLLIIGDLLMGLIALFLSLYFWAAGDAWMNFSIEFLRSRPEFWYYLLPLLWIILIIELYDLKKANNLIETLKGIGLGTSIYIILYLVFYFTSEPNSLPRLGVAVFIISVALLTLAWRMIYIRLFRTASLQRRVLIVGAGKAGSTLVDVLDQQDPPPFNLIGLVDDDPNKIGTKIHEYPILAGGDQLLELIRSEKISDLVLAISGEMESGMFHAILSAQEAGINLTTMSEMYESLLGRVPIFLLESDWVIRSFVEKIPASNIYRILKRGLDVLGGLVGLAVLVVIYPFVALAILIDSGKPVIFKQERLGRGGNPYALLKFRTMFMGDMVNGEQPMTSKNDPRITRVGRFLRKTHLDEWPQFLNVLQGEMSLVGPRSERNEFVQIFQEDIPFYRARMLVKPGITGWAQINQSYAETVEETAVKLEYDLYYIQNRNIFMDIVILIRTIGSSLGFKGR